MGLSPAAGGGCGRRFPRFPRPRLKAASRTASIRPNDSQPAPGHAAVPQSGRRRNEAPLHRASTPRPGTPPGSFPLSQPAIGPPARRLYGLSRVGPAHAQAATAGHVRTEQKQHPARGEAYG
nr:uncharacterized protein LOC102535742 isoform X4 [Vicugna pacos]